MSVPALERGLTIIEKVASSPEGLSFGELVSEFKIANASLARLLTVLQEYNYIRKDEQTGSYIPGDNMALMGKQSTIQQILSSRSDNVLEELKTRTNNTAILFYWTGSVTICINKKLDDSMIGMQPIGMIKDDILTYPWGCFFYHDASDKQKQKMVKSSPEVNLETIQKNIDFFMSNGFVSEGESTLVRLAAPIYNNKQNIVGAVAIGGNILTIPKAEHANFANYVVIAGRELTKLITHCEN